MVRLLVLLERVTTPSTCLFRKLPIVVEFNFHGLLSILVEKSSFIVVILRCDQLTHKYLVKSYNLQTTYNFVFGQRP